MPNVCCDPNATGINAVRIQRIRGRVLLMLLLVPLLAVSHLLYTQMPTADLGAQFDGRRPFVYWENPQSNTRTNYNGNPFQNLSEPIKLMNVITGKISSATRADLFWHEGLNSRGERVAIGSLPSRNQETPQPPADRRCVYFKNMETGETRHVEFNLPGGNMEIANNRYAVSRDQNRIYAVDLEDAELQTFSISSPYTGTDLSGKPIFGTELLYEIHTSPQLNSSWEFFKIDNHQIHLIKTLQFGRAYGASKTDGQILTLSADGGSVDVRSTADLDIIESVKTSEQFLANHDVVELFGSLIVGQNKQTFELDYYDVFEGEQLKLPSLTRVVYRWYSRNIRYRFFEDGPNRQGRKTYVYDLKERRVCLAVPHSDQISFLEDGRFAIFYPAYGVCTVIYDLETGKSIRHAPFQWFAAALTATLLAWFGWWIAWIFVAAREGSSPWIDLAIVFGILPALLMYVGVGKLYPHVGLWGSSTNFALLIGVFIGLLCASGCYFAFCRSRWSVALLPFTLVYAALNWWLSAIGTQPRILYFRVCLVVTSCIVLVIAAGVLMRWIGFRLKKSVVDPSPSGDTSSQLSVFDLFIFIACAGVVMAASKPLVVPMPKISLQFLVDRYWLPTTLAATVISFAVLLTAFSQRKWVAKIGFAFALVAWCILVLQQNLIFAGVPLMHFAIQSTAIQTIVMASTTAFICALALRLRNYRLCRL